MITSGKLSPSGNGPGKRFAGTEVEGIAEFLRAESQENAPAEADWLKQHADLADEGD